METESVTYEVEYRYYQFNSGAADNGEYVRRREFASAEDALALARRIEACVAGTLDEDSRRELEDDLIPWAGYFRYARVFKITRELVPVPAPGEAPAL